MAALFSRPLRSIAPKSRRCLPDQETSPVLLESGLRLYDLHRGREYISVSIGVPATGAQKADRILGRVRFDEFEYSAEFGRLSAIPACGVNERLVDFLRDYGVGSYESKFDLNTLFSTHLDGWWTAISDFFQPCGMRLSQPDAPEKDQITDAEVQISGKYDDNPTGG